MNTPNGTKTVRHKLPVLLLVIVTLLNIGQVNAQSQNDGQIRQIDKVEVWNKALNKWVSPLEFWTVYAAMNGGLIWGIRKDYPEYSKVKEHDLMIIETEKGACLMEFFHRRWRRANDVRRWDAQFNKVEGCPHVFD